MLHQNNQTIRKTQKLSSSTEALYLLYIYKKWLNRYLAKVSQADFCGNTLYRPNTNELTKGETCSLCVCQYKRYEGQAKALTVVCGEDKENNHEQSIPLFW